MQIRKCESVTTHYTSEVANLDPEKFRNISNPFEGETEEDFLNYLSEIGLTFEDFADELDEETSGELSKLMGGCETPFWYSTYKGSNEWYESGVVDENNKRNGNFITNFSTDDNW